jgi:endonuclease/exonuclease/phosphatase family metal-dependent hydrolase
VRWTTLVAVVALAGCREATAIDDAPDAAARMPDARPAATVPSGASAIGRADRVDLLCWNVRQFPATPSTPAALARLIQDLAVDVVALFEIDDDLAFRALLDLLPGWSGYLGDGDGYIKGALVWKTSEVTVAAPENLFDGDFDFPRPPIATTVTRGSDSMTLVTVHLKAGRNPEDAARRAGANDQLVAWLAARGNPKAIVCGDFNEDLDNAYAPDVYAAWLASPETYRFLTAELDRGGAETFIPATRVMFDHILATAALDEQLAGEAAFIPPLDREVAGYEDLISDHLPVAIRIDLR